MISYDRRKDSVDEFLPLFCIIYMAGLLTFCVYIVISTEGLSKFMF